MKIGIAADHGGFDLKTKLVRALEDAGHEVEDFGASGMDPADDYPDYIVPLAKAVAEGKIERGIAICGSGVGACIAANKIPNARAALITEAYSARQGVEDDDMNIICLGGRVLEFEKAWRLAQSFISARFKTEERFIRRIKKIAAIENPSRAKG